MSENLSFTQELRRLGIIADNSAKDTTSNINSDKKTENINDETEKNEEVKTTDVKKEQKQFGFNDKRIYVGKKPAMNYVLAINSRMHEGLDKITIKSRGKMISKAVDVAEIVTNRFVTDANDDEVKLSTEEIFKEDGTSTNVSTIEIVIKRD